MSIQSIQKQHLGSLFPEPSMNEIGVWCQLGEEVNPSEWAHLCRLLGMLGAEQFEVVKRMLLSGVEAVQGGKWVDGSSRTPVAPEPPLLSLGPSGLGGDFHREIGEEF